MSMLVLTFHSPSAFYTKHFYKVSLKINLYLLDEYFSTSFLLEKYGKHTTMENDNCRYRNLPADNEEFNKFHDL